MFCQSIGYWLNIWVMIKSSLWWVGYPLSWCWWQQANDTHQLISAVTCHSPPFQLLIGQSRWEPSLLIGRDQDWLLGSRQGQGSDQEPWESRQRKQQFTIYRWTEQDLIFVFTSFNSLWNLDNKMQQEPSCFSKDFLEHPFQVHLIP